MDSKELHLQKLRYQELAWRVVRDAIGFYFGIPKFLNSSDSSYQEAFKKRLNDKIVNHRKHKGCDPSEDDIISCKESVEIFLEKRINTLKEDYNHCKLILFEDNEWLQLLDINKNFLKEVLPALPSDIKDALAVVPDWLTLDYTLRRSYINDGKFV